MKRFLLPLFILGLLAGNYLHAQQVNGVFTPFAKNNEWGNTAINSVKIETNG